MHEFSLATYRHLLLAFESAGYAFCQFEEIKQRLAAKEPFVVLRHDIDISLRAALEIAHLEHELGVQATYFVTFHSPFYNLLSWSNARTLSQIHQLGHQIALHLDFMACEEQYIDALAEIDILAQYYPYSNTQLASLHSPSNLELFPIESFRQLQNVYGTIFSKEMTYLSDSTGRWRYGHPLESEAFSSRRPIQLLTHPIWWLQEGELPREKLEAWLYKDYLNVLATAKEFLPKLFRDTSAQQEIRR
ncbi:MAG: hypothetical protein ABI456_03730 [Ktedonobacteraceae bacterium]|nr:hypothetical protein [Chloroflexota bacterium]